MATYTAEEYGQLLDRFAKGFPKAIDRATFEAAQQLNVMMANRIFNESGTKDIKGGGRTYKSESWKEKRRDKGLGTTNVDLIFDTNLQGSLKLFEVKKGVELRVVGKVEVKNSDPVLNIDKARGNEKLFGAKVFEASKKEEDITQEVFDEVISQYLDTLFD